MESRITHLLQNQQTCTVPSGFALTTSNSPGSQQMRQALSLQHEMHVS